MLYTKCCASYKAVWAQGVTRGHKVCTLYSGRCRRGSGTLSTLKIDVIFYCTIIDTLLQRGDSDDARLNIVTVALAHRSLLKISQEIPSDLTLVSPLLY